MDLGTQRGKLAGDAFKVGLSLMMGFLCLWGANYGIPLTVAGKTVYLIWSIVFPGLIFWVWGCYYGLLSLSILAVQMIGFLAVDAPGLIAKLPETQPSRILLDLAFSIVGVVLAIQIFRYRRAVETAGQASETRSKLLFEEMLNGFFVVEPVYEGRELIDLRFVEFSPGSEQQSTLTAAVIGKSWSEATGYPTQYLDTYRRIMATGQAEKLEPYNPVRQRHYRANAFKVDDRVGVFFDDVTAYRQAIHEIKELNKDLEKRVGERTIDLENVIAELEAFAFIVSHDLKAPLRAISGYAKFIIEDYGPELHPDLGQMVTNIATIGNDAIKLIDRLLAYSLTSRRQLTKEAMNLQTMTTDVFDHLQTAYSNREMELRYERPLPWIHADKVLMREVVFNILTNAIKFSKDRPKTVITISCRTLATEYQVAIQDNGVGFDMEYAGKLFAVFQRLHSAEEFEGHGIGLATNKKIIQKHGGRIWIEGRLGAGATVYFTIPIVQQ